MEYGFSHIVFSSFENSGANCREVVIACVAGENGNGSGKRETGDSLPLTPPFSIPTPSPLSQPSLEQNGGNLFLLLDPRSNLIMHLSG